MSSSKTNALIGQIIVNQDELVATIASMTLIQSELIKALAQSEKIVNGDELLKRLEEVCDRLRQLTTIKIK